MGIFDASLDKNFLFKTAKTPDLSKYTGRTVVIPGALGGKMVIKTIKPSYIKPVFYVINESHFISMLRFFAQMNNDNSITEEQFKSFEQMEHEVTSMADQTDGNPQKVIKDVKNDVKN